MQESIKEVIEAEVGSHIDFKGIVRSIKEAKKLNGELFLNLEIADADDFIQFPIWDKVAERKELIKNGDLIRVIGTAKDFSGARQVNVYGMKIVEDESIEKYIPKYKITENLLAYFKKIYDNLDTPYKDVVSELTGFERYADKWDDYITCVAAEKGHQNRQAGLFVHSIGVLKNVDNMMIDYIENPFFTRADNVINPSRLRTLAIVHDVCKIDEYEFRNGIFRKPNAIDHRIKFVSVLDSIKHKIDLSDEDIYRMQYSVLAHHGPWGGNKPKTLEDSLLHFADMIDSKIVGCVEADDEKERINFGITGMINATDR